MNTTRWLTTASLVTAFCLNTGVASADDYKQYAGSMCFPGRAFPTSYQSVTYIRDGFGYIQNNGSVSIGGPCPIIRDQWGGTAGPDAWVYFYDASSSSEACATLYASNAQGSVAYTRTVCTGVSFTGWKEVYIAAITSYAEDSAYSLYFGLPPSGKLTNYTIGERAQNE